MQKAHNLHNNETFFVGGRDNASEALWKIAKKAPQANFEFLIIHTLLAQHSFNA